MESFSLSSRPSTLSLRLKNFCASVTLVALACALYGFAPYNRAQMQDLHGSAAFSFTGAQFLLAAALGYTVLLGLHHLVEREPSHSKSLRCFRMLAELARSPATRRRQGLSRDDRVAILATLLKSFFAPMMVMSLMVFSMSALANGSAVAASGAFDDGFMALFNRHGYWFAMQIILFIDVLIFTVGYLVESARLGNPIRSVDPTLLGWAAALLCYPPFNVITAAILGSQRSDFPHFDNPTLHLALNLLLLTLMAAYASASVALGFKASNLTHRGIVARGPYALIRHPAYTCKNLAWWIGASPLVIEAFSRSTFEGIQALASVAGWTSLYVLRALTEEDHLQSVDDEYATYAAQVRYRFIPGVA